MSNDYDPFADKSQSAQAAAHQYDATLVYKDQTTEAAKLISATSVAEAINQARQWAWEECRTRKIEKKLLLIVKGNGIYGSHSEEIDPNG